MPILSIRLTVAPGWLDAAGIAAVRACALAAARRYCRSTDPVGTPRVSLVYDRNRQGLTKGRLTRSLTQVRGIDIQCKWAPSLGGADAAAESEIEQALLSCEALHYQR